MLVYAYNLYLLNPSREMYFLIEHWVATPWLLSGHVLHSVDKLTDLVLFLVSTTGSHFNSISVRCHSLLPVSYCKTPSPWPWFVYARGEKGGGEGHSYWVWQRLLVPCDSFHLSLDFHAISLTKIQIQRYSHAKAKAIQFSVSELFNYVGRRTLICWYFDLNWCCPFRMLSMS